MYSFPVDIAVDIRLTGYSFSLEDATRFISAYAGISAETASTHVQVFASSGCELRDVLL